jgi:hypothetical protein
VDTVSGAKEGNAVAKGAAHQLGLELKALGHAKAPSPLRSAGALHIAPGLMTRSFHS